MTVQFNVREDSRVEVNNLTLILNLKSPDRNKSRKFNTKNLDDLTEKEKKCIDEVMAIVEKYVSDEQGGNDVKYTI